MKNNYTKRAGLKLPDVINLIKNIPRLKLTSRSTGTIIEELNEDVTKFNYNRKFKEGNPKNE